MPIHTQTWDVDLGSPDNWANAAQSTSVFRQGGGSLRLNPAAAVAFWLKNLSPAPSQLVYRVWVRFDAKPASSLQNVVVPNGSTTAMGVGWDFTANQFAIYDGNTLVNPGGPTVSLGAWNRIDLRVDASANPCVCDAMIDGTPLTQTTRAVAAGTFPDYRVGSTWEGLSYDLFFDDLSVSTNGADYPITDPDLPAIQSRVPMPMFAVPGEDRIMRMHGRTLGS